MQEPRIGYSLLDTFLYDVHLTDQTSAVFNIKHAENPLSVTGLSTLSDRKQLLFKTSKYKNPLSVTGFPAHSEKYVLIFKIDFEENPLSVTALYTPLGIV